MLCLFGLSRFRMENRCTLFLEPLYGAAGGFAAPRMPSLSLDLGDLDSPGLDLRDFAFAAFAMTPKIMRAGAFATRRGAGPLTGAAPPEAGRPPAPMPGFTRKLQA